MHVLRTLTVDLKTCHSGRLACSPNAIDRIWNRALFFVNASLLGREPLCITAGSYSPLLALFI